MDEEYYRLVKNGPVRARHVGSDDDGTKRRMHNARKVGEWLSVPTHQGILTGRRKERPVLYVQLLPAPNNTWQWCRVDLDKPFARGFSSRELARKWLESAVAAGIIPKVVELEGQPGGGDATEP